jgi:signal transduction histidine kinase
MSIKARLTLLLGLLLLAFLAALAILRQLGRNREEELLAGSMQANQVVVQRWIDLLSQPVQRLGQDYSQWPELLRFIAHPDAAWAETNLRQTLPGYEAQALWLTDTHGRLLYSARVNDGPAFPLPLAADELTRLAPAGGGRRFFAEDRDGLMEIWLYPVVEAGVGPRGWLLVARLWGAPQITTLSRLVEAQIQLGPPLPPAAGRQRTQLLIPLQDLHDATVRQLVVQFPVPDFTESLVRDTLAANLFVAFGLLVVAAVWVGVRKWVMTPLDRITESLALEDTSFIQPLKRDNSELGRVAQLIDSAFTQKAALKREIEERTLAESALRESELRVRRSLELRARLARDLHDGVIQSIYAAGLGLESALSQLAQDQSGVRQPLQQCRRSLNDIIREVRGFITGLEPEQMPRQAFALELESLARTMQALWPVRITLEIDPAVARRLNAGQEVHALQIVRECISNALRHGGAKAMHITLAADSGPGGILTVRDNGRGFLLAERSGKGSGLLNFATRAAEMGGSAQILSEPGQGATIMITFRLDQPVLV